MCMSLQFGNTRVEPMPTEVPTHACMAVCRPKGSSLKTDDTHAICVGRAAAVLRLSHQVVDVWIPRHGDWLESAVNKKALVSRSDYQDSHSEARHLDSWATELAFYEEEFCSAFRDLMMASWSGRDLILTPVNFNGVMIRSRKAELDSPSFYSCVTHSWLSESGNSLLGRRASYQAPACNRDRIQTVEEVKSNKVDSKVYLVSVSSRWANTWSIPRPKFQQLSTHCDGEVGERLQSQHDLVKVAKLSDNLSTSTPWLSLSFCLSRIECARNLAIREGKQIHTRKIACNSFPDHSTDKSCGSDEAEKRSTETTTHQSSFQIFHFGPGARNMSVCFHLPVTELWTSKYCGNWDKTTWLPSLNRGRIFHCNDETTHKEFLKRF